MKQGFLLFLSAAFMIGSHSAEACCSHHRNPGGVCEVWCTKGTMCAPSNCGSKEGDDSINAERGDSKPTSFEDQENDNQIPRNVPAVMIRTDNNTAKTLVNQFEESTGNL